MRYKLAAFLLSACSLFGQASGNATRLQGRALSASAPSNTNVICWTASSSSWGPCAASGGGETPGGSANQYQYNSAGTTFGGSAILSYDGTNRRNVMARANIEFDPVSAPSAPTAALLVAGGNVDAGAHQYCVTYVNAISANNPNGVQETECSTASNVVTTDAMHGQVSVTGLGATCPTGATGKNLYRSAVATGDSEQLLPGMPLSCATASYTDNTADSGLGVYVTNLNTTTGIFYYASGTIAAISNLNRWGNANIALDGHFSFDSGREFLVDSAFYGDAPNTSVNYGAFTEFFASADATANANTSANDITTAWVDATLDGTGGFGTFKGIYLTPTINVSGSISFVAGIANSSSISGGTVTDFYGYRGLTGVFGGTVTNHYGIYLNDVTGASNNWAIKTGTGKVEFDDLKTTGAATGKTVVCVDTTTGILYASTSGVACAN